MAIESAAVLRWFARTVCLVLLLTSSLCVAAVAQVPTVFSGSVAGIPHETGNVWGQIYKIEVSKNGDVLFLDNEKGALYRLLPDGHTMTTVAGPGLVLKGGGNFWNAGMALDSHDTLYITDRWDNNVRFFRVAYDPVTNKWPLTSDSAWGLSTGLHTKDIDIDANDDLIVSGETPFNIYRIHVDAEGNPGEPQPIITGLKASAAKIAVDRSGNIFFIEDPWSPRSSVVAGVFMIPAGRTVIATDEQSGTGWAEAQCVRIDPIRETDHVWLGIDADAAGNIYLSNQNDTFPGGSGGIVMVPNESGTLNPDHAVLVAPIPASAAITIDPRGYIWAPVGTSGWAPGGSLTIPYSEAFVKYIPGSADLGAALINTPGATATVFFSFSGQTTLGAAGLDLSQLGAGSDFAIIASDPNPDPAATDPAVPCVPGATYQPYARCRVWVSATPRVPGGASAQLRMLDAAANVVSAASLHAIGQGPALSVLVPSAQVPIGSGFSATKQVAADSQGHSYVADSARGEVLQYARGASSASSPSATISGLTAPTGVAVDNIGNVYIGETGKVVVAQCASGSCGSVSDVLTGLGANLNLAVDGAGTVFVADPDNHRVVRIPNASARAFYPQEIVTAGSGFTAPLAVTVDPAGNLFVVDGQNLLEVPVAADQKTITNRLNAPTGVAVDASGSVYVAQAGGLIRIPILPDGALSFNDAVLLGGSTITHPVGVAQDVSGNLYVTEIASLTQLSTNGELNFNEFGPVNPDVEAGGEVQVFNIGNQPLTFAAMTHDQITGTNAAEFQVIAPESAPACNPETPTVAGSHCWVGVGLTAAGADGNRSAMLTIPSDAANASPITVALTGNAQTDTRPRTQTTVTWSPDTLTYPADVTVTVTVASLESAGTPSGTVAFALTGQAKRTATLDGNGRATFSYEGLRGGAYRAKASYLGEDPNFAVSVDSKEFTVAPAVPVITASAPPLDSYGPYVLLGSSSNMTATVSSTVGTPTGRVRFLSQLDPPVLADSSQAYATLGGEGKVTFNTSNLAQGAHTIYAVYDGDTNFATVVATAVTFQIVPPRILITAEPPTLSLAQGVPGTASLKLHSIVGFASDTQPIRLSCEGLPQYSECTFSRPEPWVSTGETVDVTVTISTNIPVNVSSRQGAPGSASTWVLAGMFGMGLAGAAFRKKFKHGGRLFVTICVVALITGALAGVSACTNNGYTKTPPAPHVTSPAGAYSVDIVARQAMTGQVVSLPFTLNTTVQEAH